MPPPTPPSPPTGPISAVPAEPSPSDRVSRVISQGWDSLVDDYQKYGDTIVEVIGEEKVEASRSVVKQFGRLGVTIGLAPVTVSGHGAGDGFPDPLEPIEILFGLGANDIADREDRGRIDQDFNSRLEDEIEAAGDESGPIQRFDKRDP